MKICNAQGNGICIGCDGKPPKLNGYSYGDVCRYTAQKVIDRLASGEIVAWNYETGKFYSKWSPLDPVYEIDDGDWEEI